MDPWGQQPGAARSSQQQPGATRSSLGSQEQPGAAKCGVAKYASFIKILNSDQYSAYGSDLDVGGIHFSMVEVQLKNIPSTDIGPPGPDLNVKVSIRTRCKIAVYCSTACGKAAKNGEDEIVILGLSRASPI